LKYRHWIGLVFLSIGILGILWGFRPIENRKILEFTIPLDGLESPVGIDNELISPLKGIQILLDGPRQLGVGEEVIIKLRIDPFEPGKNSITDEIQPTNNLVLEARLEVDGAQISPMGEVFAPLDSHQPSVIEWKIQAERGEQVDGILWLHLYSFPSKINPEELPAQKKLIAAPQITLPVSSFFGLGDETIKIFGIVVSGIGFFLLFEPGLVSLLKARS
jgi:hypothetical protein